MALNRRELMGSAAASAPVVAVHLDTPYVSAHGSEPYSPAAEAGLVEPQELA